MKLQQQIGTAIRQARARAGLTQAALAARVEVGEQFVSELERGTSTPSLPTLAKIAEALAIPIRDLFPHPLAAEQDDADLAAVVGMMAPLSAEERARVRRIVEAAVKGP